MCACWHVDNCLHVGSCLDVCMFTCRWLFTCFHVDSCLRVDNSLHVCRLHLFTSLHVDNFTQVRTPIAKASLGKNQNPNQNHGLGNSWDPPGLSGEGVWLPLMKMTYSVQCAWVDARWQICSTVETKIQIKSWLGIILLGLSRTIRERFSFPLPLITAPDPFLLMNARI